ncbi:MAG: radical SAM protein [Oscillospiraceae bacterium]|nr:radical SAM protein [Oscillospiraceae bacterium]
MKAKTNAAIFIPHLGCPHQCSFCDQNKITKTAKSVDLNDVSAILENHVASLQRRGLTAEIAFFGGTFTALEPDYREELLRIANQYLKKHGDIFKGIRCSTRPDYIDEYILEQLRAKGVTAIELGAQSMDDEVLAANRRGHTADDVRNACRLIRNYGFELGLQMMTGLYKDAPENSLYTADEIIKLRPDTARIYPTVIFPGTRLAELDYETFSEEETAELCGEIYGRFVRNHIRVIRIGLNYSGNVIGELSISRYYYHKMLSFMKNSGSRKFKIFTDKRNISKINGHQCENKIKLEQLGFTYKIKEKKGTELEIHAI